MGGEDRFARASAAYAVLKKSMDERYPHGRFVAIAGGKLVADAESIEELKAALSAIGLALDDVAIDQAGIGAEDQIPRLGDETAARKLDQVRPATQ